MRPTSARPLVTVVTPSFNQAPYLRQALDSVLGQDHRPLEHIVVDGGSTDGSVEILRDYAGEHPDRLRWTSEPDRGQSHAINKGLGVARGEIVAWLNSDDAYEPGAVSAAVRAFRENPDAGLVYGGGVIIDRAGRPVGPFAHAEPFNLWRLVYVWDYVLQPAAFFRRDLLERVGGLREDLHYAMDWDLWIRLGRVARAVYVQRPLARSREYGEAKTFRGGWPRFRELARLMRAHGGRRYPPGWFLYGSDTLDRHLVERLPAPLRERARRRVRWFQDLMFRRLPVHADGWLAPLGRVLVPASWTWMRLCVEAPGVASLLPLGVEVACGTRVLLARRLGEPGAHLLETPLPPRAREAAFRELTVRSDRSFRPCEASASGDRRRLALRLLGVEGGSGAGPVCVAA